MPVVRPLGQNRRASPNLGHSPFSMTRLNGAAEPRLTSGGEAPAKRSRVAFRARLVEVQP